MIENKNLSEHFTLYSLLKSDTAERQLNLKTLQFNPPISVQQCLEYLTTHLLEPIRVSIGGAIFVTSGYRCLEVNKLVGGVPTSQHVFGQAADLNLDPGFLKTPAGIEFKTKIEKQIFDIVKKPVRGNVNSSFFLFAFICLNIKTLPVDQVIHEFGSGPGSPAWVHASCTKERSRKQILIISNSGTKILTVEQALLLGC